MKRSIEMLLTLDLNNSEAVQLFLDTLQQEFQSLFSSKRDPLEQADNLLNALSEIAKVKPAIFNQELFVKLDELYDVLPDQKGQQAYLLSEFANGFMSIKIIMEEASEELAKLGINYQPKDLLDQLAKNVGINDYSSYQNAKLTQQYADDYLAYVAAYVAAYLNEKSSAEFSQDLADIAAKAQDKLALTYAALSLDFSSWLKEQKANASSNHGTFYLTHKELKPLHDRLQNTLTTGIAQSISQGTDNEDSNAFVTDYPRDGINGTWKFIKEGKEVLADTAEELFEKLEFNSVQQEILKYLFPQSGLTTEFKYELEHLLFASGENGKIMSFFLDPRQLVLNINAQGNWEVRLSGFAFCKSAMGALPPVGIEVLVKINNPNLPTAEITSEFKLGINQTEAHSQHYQLSAQTLFEVPIKIEEVDFLSKYRYQMVRLLNKADKEQSSADIRRELRADIQLLEKTFDEANLRTEQEWVIFAKKIANVSYQSSAINSLVKNILLDIERFLLSQTAIELAKAKGNQSLILAVEAVFDVVKASLNHVDKNPWLNELFEEDKNRKWQRIGTLLTKGDGAGYTDQEWEFVNTVKCGDIRRDQLGEIIHEGSEGTGSIVIFSQSDERFEFTAKETFFEMRGGNFLELINHPANQNKTIQEALRDRYLPEVFCDSSAYKSFCLHAVGLNNPQGEHQFDLLFKEKLATVEQPKKSSFHWLVPILAIRPQEARTHLKPGFFRNLFLNNPTDVLNVNDVVEIIKQTAQPDRFMLVNKLFRKPTLRESFLNFIRDENKSPLRFQKALLVDENIFNELIGFLLKTVPKDDASLSAIEDRALKEPTLLIVYAKTLSKQNKLEEFLQRLENKVSERWGQEKVVAENALNVMKQCEDFNEVFLKLKEQQKEKQLEASLEFLVNDVLAKIQEMLDKFSPEVQLEMIGKYEPSSKADSYLQLRKSALFGKQDDAEVEKKFDEMFAAKLDELSKKLSLKAKNIDLPPQPQVANNPDPSPGSTPPRSRSSSFGGNA